MEEAVSIYSQIFGALHENVAAVYRNLAMLNAEMGDNQMAIELQRKYLMIAERLIGFDNPDTLNQYVSVINYCC